MEFSQKVFSCSLLRQNLRFIRRIFPHDVWVPQRFVLEFPAVVVIVPVQLIPVVPSIIVFLVPGGETMVPVVAVVTIEVVAIVTRGGGWRGAAPADGHGARWTRGLFADSLGVFWGRWGSVDILHRLEHSEHAPGRLRGGHFLFQGSSA